MYSVFMRANINNTNEERESFDASFFVGGGERSFFFLDGFCHAWREQKIYESFSFAKRGHSHPKGDGDFSATSFSAPDPQADRRDRLLCVRILIHFTTRRTMRKGFRSERRRR